MTYRYEDEREGLFDADGQRTFLAHRDAAFELIDIAGACRLGEVIDLAIKRLGAVGSFESLACLDRMVELGELRELTDPATVWGQHRVFVRVAGSGCRTCGQPRAHRRHDPSFSDEAFWHTYRPA